MTVMEVRDGGGAATVRAAEPETPLRVAVRVADPGATAVARPELVTVASAAFEVVQVAVADRFCVEPSLYVPVAANCCVEPAVTVAAEGVIEIEERTGAGAETCTVAVPLMLPRDAVTVAEPAATAVSVPLEFTVATEAALLAQLAELLMSALEPSL